MDHRIELSGSVGASGHLTTMFCPALQDRDWQVRWEQLETRLSGITRLRTETRSSENLHSAVQDLQEFFISAYHLKDVLIADQAVPESAVESAITSSEVLALLADLANLEKHRQRTRGLRSGAAPVVSNISDISDGYGWHLVMTITHGGTHLDGLDFAANVIDEWRSRLRGWGLI